MPHVLYIALGSNLGDKERNILTAIERINETVGAVERQSSLFVTEPQGFRSENLFVNAAVKVRTVHSPQECLLLTQKIERDMGRTEKSSAEGYKDRIIDLDILLYDEISISTPSLTIPHPRMYQRDFVMMPLREIMDI